MPGIVSITTARRILGTVADKLSDDQISNLINNLSLLAKEQILYNGSKINESKDENEPIKQPN